MATGRGVPSVGSVAIKRTAARRTTMHPLGTYLAIKDSQREHRRVAAQDRRAEFARVDAMPIIQPEPTSRIRRLAAIARRRVMRTAGA
jgi:hypothetical protein